jgi:hypothetical protein
MPFGARYLVDAEHSERFELLPIDCGGDPAVENAKERINGDILLGADIDECAVDELYDEVTLILLVWIALGSYQPSCWVVGGWSSQYGQRKRLGWMRR